MKQLIIKINKLKPISTNEMNEKGISRSKLYVKNSDSYSFFRKVVAAELRKQWGNVCLFNDFFDKSKHVINARFIYFIPKDKIFTKSGNLKLGTHDLDNFQKPTIDAIFKNLPYTVEMSKGKATKKYQLDDSFIFNEWAIKTVSPDDDYHIEIQLYIESQKKHLEQFKI